MDTLTEEEVCPPLFFEVLMGLEISAAEWETIGRAIEDGLARGWRLFSLHLLV